MVDENGHICDYKSYFKFSMAVTQAYISCLKWNDIRVIVSRPTFWYRDTSFLKSNPVYSVQQLPWWLTWSSVCLLCGRPGFDPWVGKMPWRRKEPGRLQSMGWQRVGHDWVTSLSLFLCTVCQLQTVTVQLLFNLDSLYFFSSLTTEAWTLKTMLSDGDDSGHPCFLT